MDFNDIQAAWNNEKTSNIVLPTNIEKLQSVNTPLNRIRKNLKKDFLIHILGVLFVGILSLFIEFNPVYRWAFYSVYGLSLVLTGFFLVKLFFLYKKIGPQNNNTKDDLNETYFEIRLFEEVYKMISYALMPSGFFYMILIPLGAKTEKVMRIMHVFKNPEFLYIGIVVAFVAYLVLLWFMVNAHAEMFYGKYAKDIRKVIGELKEE